MDADEIDTIGCRHFMECVLCRGLQELQEMYTTMEGSNVTGEQWAMGVIVKLLEVTHRQLLYHCIQVHDRGERNSSYAPKGGAADGDRISTKIRVG